MNDKKYGSLTSSVNSEELSLSFTSTVRLFVSVFVAFGYMNVVQANNLVEAAPAIAAAGYAAIQGLELVWGLVRKAIASYYAKQDVVVVDRQ